MSKQTFSVHPLYQEMRDEWVKWRDVFEGKHSVLRQVKYLTPHNQENTKDDKTFGNKIRLAREQRTKFMKISEMIVSLWQSIFMKGGVTLDKATKDTLTEDGAYSNIDGQGTSFEKFIQDHVLKNYFIYGRPWILVDAFPGERGTLQDEAGGRARAYMECLSPLSVYDFEIESSDPTRAGRLNSFRKCYQFLKPRTSVKDAISIETRCDIYTYSKDGILVERFRVVDGGASVGKIKAEEELEWEPIPDEGGASFTLKLAEIPVARIDSESWVDGVVEENLRHFNLRSSKDNIEHQQAYQKIFISADNVDPNQFSAMNECLVAIIPANSSVVTIESVNTDGLRLSVAEAVDNCFKIGLNQVRSLPGDSRAVQGADTILEEKDNLYTLVLTARNEIEELVNEALRYYLEFRGRGGEPKFAFGPISATDFKQWLETYAATKDTLSKLDGFDRAVARKIIPRLEFTGDDEKDLLEKVETLKTETPEEKLQKRQELMKGLIDGAGAKRIPGAPESDQRGN